MRDFHPFFLNDAATPQIYTLSLHDALPISCLVERLDDVRIGRGRDQRVADAPGQLRDRKSTRLNSSHANISYAVFCLKKKKKAAPGGSVCPDIARWREVPFPRPHRGPPTQP